MLSKKEVSQKFLTSVIETWHMEHWWNDNDKEN